MPHRGPPPPHSLGPGPPGQHRVMMRQQHPGANQHHMQQQLLQQQQQQGHPGHMYQQHLHGPPPMLPGRWAAGAPGRNGNLGLLPKALIMWQPVAGAWVRGRHVITNRISQDLDSAPGEVRSPLIRINNNNELMTYCSYTLGHFTLSCQVGMLFGVSGLLFVLLLFVWLPGFVAHTGPVVGFPLIFFTYVRTWPGTIQVSKVGAFYY